MKIIHTLLASSLVACSFVALSAHAKEITMPTDLSQKAKPATIKVLISKNASEALVEVKGRYQIYNPFDSLPISSGIMGKRHYLYPSEEGVKWGDNLRGIFQMRIVPGDSQSHVLVDGIQYRGCVEIYQIDETLNIVNEVDMESYLKSLLTTQFPHELPTEVMDAVAILARTHAYYFVSRNTDSFWHVDAQEVGYQGYGLTFQNLHVDRAVESTRHVVLTYHNIPFAATWTPDSAGKTAEFSSIFRKEAPAPEGVDAPFAARDREKHRWSFTISKAQLAKTTKISSVTGIDLYVEKNSGKVYGVRIDDKGSPKDMDFFAFQQAVGKSKLLSNDFTVSIKGDSLVFSGFGEGHGVGLCLYSAKLMAEKGEGAQKILAAFFPNTRVQNMRTLAAPENLAEQEEKRPSKR